MIFYGDSKIKGHKVEEGQINSNSKDNNSNNNSNSNSNSRPLALSALTIMAMAMKIIICDIARIVTVVWTAFKQHLQHIKTSTVEEDMP